MSGDISNTFDIVIADFRPANVADRKIKRDVSGATEENGAESIGKALFNLTELARRLGVDAEQALSEACRAYIEQFGAEE